MGLKFKDYVNKAQNEGAKLEIKFIKVTDSTERTIEYCVNSGVSYNLDLFKQVSQRVLKAIEKNHDRVFSQDYKWVGGYFIYPELITENSNVHGKQFKTTDGQAWWQWRSMYIEQILEIKFNNEVVFKNEGTFDFSMIGDEGKIYTVLPYEKYLAIQKAEQEREYDRVKREAEWKLVRDKAKELAKTLKPEDACQNLGMMNGWSYANTPEVVERVAIQIKHSQLAHEHPEQHKMYDVESASAQMHGYHDLRCACGYGYGWDSSD